MPDSGGTIDITGLGDPGDLLAHGAPATPADPGLVHLADDVAVVAASFVATVEGVAGGGAADEAIALLLLETAELARTGARLGALTDVVPEGRFEPDAGREPDVDRVREGLRGLFGDLDRYAVVGDPYGDPEVEEGSLGDDLAETVSDLLHGLAHHAAGRPMEALWWWQYAYLASWGESSLRALTALRALVALVRLEADAADPAASGL